MHFWSLSCSVWSEKTPLPRLEWESVCNRLLATFGSLLDISQQLTLGKWDFNDWHRDPCTLVFIWGKMWTIGPSSGSSLRSYLYSWVQPCMFNKRNKLVHTQYVWNIFIPGKKFLKTFISVKDGPEKRTETKQRWNNARRLSDICKITQQM